MTAPVRAATLPPFLAILVLGVGLPVQATGATTHQVGEHLTADTSGN